jgi:sodium/potassium/calcium exchanger 6
MKKSFSKSFSSSGGGFGVFVPPLLLLLLLFLCLLVFGGDGGGFSPIKVAAAATKTTSSSSSSSAFGGGFDGKSSRFEGRGRRRSRFLLQEEEDQEQAEEVEKKLRNLIPVEGTTETEEEDAGGEVAAATATTNTKHSLLHSEVVRAHTPTAQTKDETVVEEVIAKQSEDNTDAEASEAIVAADVSEEAPATKEEVTSDDESAEDIAEEEKEKADSEYASENAEELAVETAAANAIADAVIAESDEENAAEKDGETVDEKITKSAAKKAAKFFANVKTRAKERFEKRAQEELAFYADYEDYEDDYGAAPDALTGDGFDSPADLVASGEETIEEAKEDIKDIEAEKAAIAQEKGMQMALEEIQATDLAEPTADVADPITGISPQGEQLEEQMATANGEPKPVANTPMYSLESGYDVRSALRGARSKAKKCEPKKRLTREAQCKHVRNTRACGGNLYPYLKFAYCTNAGIVIPTVIYAFGLGVSLYALALVADAFFCPALETVATILKISPEVAGATLLALGNGAPDVFAQVAAVTSGTMPDVDMAVSTALGSGLFITTVILGVVILMDRTKNASDGSLTGVLVSAAPYNRDVYAYLIGILTVFAIMIKGVIALWHTTLLASAYAAYIVLAVFKDEGIDDDDDDEDSAPVFTLDGDEENSNKKKKSRTREVPLFDLASQKGGPDDNKGADLPRRKKPKMLRLGPADGLLEGAFAWAMSEAQWDDMTPSQKALAPITTPIFLVMSLTMPVIREGRLGKGYTTALAFIAPLFFLAAPGSATAMFRDNFPGSPYFWILCISAGCSVVTGIKLQLEKEGPKAASEPIAMLAFINSIVWMHLAAEHLVLIIDALAKIAGISEEFLGATVLAWANCVGDLVSNMAVAKAGQAAMAVTACFAGPVFNLLVGLAASLVYVNIVLGDVQVQVGNSVLVLLVGSIASLLLVLSLTVRKSDYEYALHAKLGWSLIGFYVLFSVFFCLVELGKVFGSREVIPGGTITAGR